MGHDELRAGLGARHRLRRGRFPVAATHPRHDSAQSRVLQVVAGQPEVLVEAGRLDVPPRRDHQAAHPRRYLEEDGRGRAQGQEEGPRGGDRGGARPVLQRRHRRSDGGLPPETRRAVREERLLRVLRQGRRADVHHLQGLHGLQAGLRQPGAVAAADAEHPRELRPARDGAQQPGLHSHADRGDEAVVRGPRHLLRGPGVREGARRRPAVEGVCERARRTDRHEASLDPAHRRRPPQVRHPREDLAVLGRQGGSGPRRPS